MWIHGCRMIQNQASKVEGKLGLSQQKVICNLFASQTQLHMVLVIEQTLNFFSVLNWSANPTHQGRCGDKNKDDGKLS